MKGFKFGIGDVVALKSNPHFPMTVYANKVGKDDDGSEEKLVYVTWVRGDGEIEMHGFIEECLVCVAEYRGTIGNLRDQLEVAERRLAEIPILKEAKAWLNEEVVKLEKKIKMYEAEELNSKNAQKNEQEPK